MLQSIRDRTHGWIAGIIFSVLILSFALWGIHSYFGGNATASVVAEVNGVDITQGQLAAAYERLRRQQQLQSNSSYPIPEQNEAQLKERALQTLVQLQVLKQGSLAQRYFISSSQVDNFLINVPEFQENSQFSMERFKQFLQASSLSAADFLELIKTSLLIDQPRLGLMFSSFALPNEVSHTMLLLNQEREIQYLILPSQHASQQSVSVDPNSILAYYDQHQEEFKVSEQVSIEYIQLTRNPKEPDAFMNQREKLAKLTYEHPDTLAPAAEALKVSVQSTELFSRDKGSRGVTENPKIREAAFSQDVLVGHNNSDVIEENENTVFVLRVKKQVPASILPFETVKNRIVEKLTLADREAKIAKWANDIRQQLESGASPQTVANQLHAGWKSLGFVSRRSNKVDPAILELAFSMPSPQNNKLSYAVAKVSQGYAIVALKGVRSGSRTGQENLFLEQIQNAQGIMEYELYKQSLVQRAKVKLTS